MSAIADPAEHEVILQHIEGLVNEVALRENIPATSLSIIYNGSLLGFINNGETTRGGAPVNEQSIFQIASLSKLMTGIVISALEDQRLLEPQVSVGEYLSQAGLLPSENFLSDTSLTELLQHRSGIHDAFCSLYKNRTEGEPWLDGYSREDLLTDISVMDIRASDNGVFQYSSCGYVVAALLAEAASGRSFQQLLNEQVTLPYGMENTMVEVQAQHLADLVQPYRKDNRLLETAASNLGVAAPASGIYSTVEDLAKLQLAQLSAYIADEESQSVSPLLLTKETGAGPEDFIRFGSGLFQIDHPAGTLLGHDGDADGYASFYVFSAEHNVGLVLLTSSGGAWVQDLSLEIVLYLMEQ